LLIIVNSLGFFMLVRVGFIGLLVATTASLAAAGSCTAQSGIKRQALIELYTSEGCSSCPPAEQWLGKQFGATDPNAIALAFHVVYWDYLGWKDQWAKPEFTQRQRWLSAKQGLSTVYTPGVFLSGREWRDWDTQQDFQNQLARAKQQDASIILRLDQSEGSTQVKVVARTIDPSKPIDPTIQLFIATTRAPFASKVSAGENRGETLSHAHVVRQWLGPFTINSQGLINATATLLSDDQNIIAIAQDTNTGRVVQAIKTKALAKGESCS
jgi:hypothetical protein